MTEHTISSLFASADLALCAQSAQPLLNMPMPVAEAAGGTAAVAQGERFAVSRGVAVVPIKGLLTPNVFVLERWFGWSTYQGIEDTMNMLASSDDVSAVVLEHDTPGGMILGIDAAHRAIAECAKAKPVHSLVNPLCASAGYWLASASTDITATPGSLTGSIGVMSATVAATEPQYEFRSTHARAKNPDPSTDEGREEIQRVLDLSERSFHEAIAAGRKIPVDDLPARLSATDDIKDGGRAFKVAEAQTRGLVDAAEPRDVFYARIFGQYSPKPRASGRRAAMAKAKAAQAAAAT